MGATYTRQSSATIVDGATIEASHFNAEFDQILAAFAASTGHTHDGTANEGGPITKLLGNTLTFGAATAGTDITITFDGETNDGALKWMEDEDYFEFSDDILVATTEKLQFRDTAIYINSSADGQLDLVADTEIQIAATTVDINGNVDISGTLTVAGALDFGDAALSNVGALQLDSIAGDGDTNTSITFSGSDVITIATGGSGRLTIGDGALSPVTDNQIDLGTSSLEFKDAYFDGTVHTDAISLDGTAITSTAAELNILDGVTSTAAELNLVDGITAGTVTASKAVIVDSNKDLTGLRNLTIAGDLTVSGDDITMATNTAGNLLVADGTNFNSVAVGSLSEISTVANDDVFLAVDTSGGGLKKITRSAVVSGLATSSAISNLSEDSTPQLGGNLDLNGNDIVTTSNADLELAPNGTGHVTVKGNTNSGAIQFNCEQNSHGQIIIGAAHSAGATNTLTIPSTGGNSTLVSDASTSTLTNKTLTSPKINEDVAVTSTATELNVLDGITAVVGELNALDIGATAIGTAVASKAVILDANKDYTGFRNITLSGELDAGSLDVSGDADIDGTLEADAITIGGVTLAETISDTVGAMVGSNTETGISVTYDDSDNTLDFVIGAGSIVNSMLADDAVGADELAANAVVNASVASGAAIADTKLATISTAGKVALTALEIDGGSDIGADLADADLIIVDDGAGGTNKKAAISRIKTYLSSAGFSQEDPTALAIALG
jgi:cytoskeletal protein CcmA (bactofilin family)